MALKGHLAEVKLISSGIVMTDEATMTGDNLVYQITDTAKRILDLNTALIVKDSAVATTEEYTVDYLNGRITFNTATPRTITITGAYLIPASVATADSFNMAITSEALDNTPFKATERTYQAGLVTGTVELGRFHVSDSLLVDALLNALIVLVEIAVDSSNSLLAYGIPATNTVDSGVEGLVKGTINYQLTTQIEV